MHPPWSRVRPSARLPARRSQAPRPGKASGGWGAAAAPPPTVGAGLVFCGQEGGEGEDRVRRWGPQQRCRGVSASSQHEGFRAAGQEGKRGQEVLGRRLRTPTSRQRCAQRCACPPRAGPQPPGLRACAALACFHREPVGSPRGLPAWGRRPCHRSCLWRIRDRQGWGAQSPSLSPGSPPRLAVLPRAAAHPLWAQPPPFAGRNGNREASRRGLSKMLVGRSLRDRKSVRFRVCSYWKSVPCLGRVHGRPVDCEARSPEGGPGPTGEAAGSACAGARGLGKSGSGTR